MAGYVPATIIPQAALSASGGTSLLTGAGGTTYIIRTLHVQAPSGARTFTMSIGADAAGKRLFDAYALTSNVPFISNEWITVAGAGAHDIDGNGSTTAVSLGAFGYTFT